jgi:putative transposase
MVKNRKLSKAISQAAWTSFTSKLIYKAHESQHCNIMKIDTFYPSTHMCNVTHEKLDFKLKLSDRAFECPHCGQTHDRDINAAKNIRDEAILQMAAVEISLGGYLVLAQPR